MADNWKSLRMRRFRNRVTKRDMARRLGCAESWINALELGHYHGPACDPWAERYRVELELAIEEKKAVR